MNSLSQELRRVISDRVRHSSPEELLAITTALCQTDSLDESVGQIDESTPLSVEERFAIGGAAGEVQFVSDAQTGLMWTRENVPGGRLTWADAKKAAEAVRAGGYSDWRLPTIQELLTLVDYTRHEPAINTDVFKCDTSYYWTSTPWNGSPGDYAWVVVFYDGGSYWGDQSFEYHVRAVRAGQIITP